MSEETMLQSTPEVASGKRFVLVDALRGIAATCVLLHHLLFHSELQKTLWLALPYWFAEFCHDGAFGVQIFFVLSGFVIAHSLRNVPLNARGVGNFMLRRQLRLDPPYWTILTLTIASMFIESHIPWIATRQLPTWADSITNYLYLQNLTGNFAIMGVSWTLCLEVQFYILFILLLVAGKNLSRVKPIFTSALIVAALGIVFLLLPRHTDISPSQWWHHFLFGASILFIVSATLLAAGKHFSRIKPGYGPALLVVTIGIGSLAFPQHFADAWFFQWWYYFAAGVICYWAVSDRRMRPAFTVFAVLYFCVAVVGGWFQFQDPKPMLTGWAAAILLYTAGRMGTLTKWLNFAPLQYLGRISYSLYLSHVLIAVYVLRFGYRITKTNQPASIFWFILAGLVSIGAAHILYLAVERTSVRFASRFKLREENAAGTPMVPATANGELKELQNV